MQKSFRRFHLLTDLSVESLSSDNIDMARRGGQQRPLFGV